MLWCQRAHSEGLRNTINLLNWSLCLEPNQRCFCLGVMRTAGLHQAVVSGAMWACCAVCVKSLCKNNRFPFFGIYIFLDDVFLFLFCILIFKVEVFSGQYCFCISYMASRALGFGLRTVHYSSQCVKLVSSVCKLATVALKTKHWAGWIDPGRQWTAVAPLGCCTASLDKVMEPHSN